MQNGGNSLEGVIFSDYSKYHVCQFLTKKQNDNYKLNIHLIIKLFMNEF